MKTRTTCTACGKVIPQSLADDALCVRCRYSEKNDNLPPPLDCNTATEYSIAAESAAFEDFAAASEAEPAPAPDFNLETVLSILIARGAKPQAVGEAVFALAYWLPMVEGRPTNTRELGERLGCSHAGAQKKLARFKAVFIDDLRVTIGESFQPPP